MASFAHFMFFFYVKNYKISINRNIDKLDSFYLYFYVSFVAKVVVDIIMKALYIIFNDMTS
ncbi:hypothetical protein ENLAB_13010 [Enterococcus innesii]|uniref:Uncharacterized protein n=1 Tax=Enterococcus innesii TaxID=2839759 RepID=A0ABM7XRN2_9ENTE|nr:hypothetical protein CO692_05425 [Enterococcus sp. FDAARGOS_375]BDG67737.1 hypothetical protein ENLAB_13010 [Enterococcus innesii]